MKTAEQLIALLPDIQSMIEDGHTLAYIATRIGYTGSDFTGDYSEAKRLDQERYEAGIRPLVSAAIMATEMFSEDELEDYARKHEG